MAVVEVKAWCPNDEIIVTVPEIGDPCPICGTTTTEIEE